MGHFGLNGHFGPNGQFGPNGHFGPNGSFWNESFWGILVKWVIFSMGRYLTDRNILHQKTSHVEHARIFLIISDLNIKLTSKIDLVSS